jgi:hypothetical protein
MDEAIGQPIKLILRPRAISLGLSLLFYIAMVLSGLARYGIPLTVAYYLLVNLAVRAQPISIDLSQDISDSFLSSFANNLKTLGPEQALSEALMSTPPHQLRIALARVRDGIPVSEALLSLEIHSLSDRALLTAISNALTYGPAEASSRLMKYLIYRQERRRIVADYLGKIAVLSLRLKILSAIAAASLAVIAFASPLLGSLSIGGGFFQGTSTEWPIPTIAFFSVSVLSPYLYSKTISDTGGMGISAICGAIYLSVFIFLGLTIGWRF